MVRFVEKGSAPKHIEDEGGWWDGNEIIVVEQDDIKEELKILLHEIMEWYLESRGIAKHDDAHNIALRLERCVDEIL